MELAKGTALREADFRAFLQKTLVERCRANPRYSLRAFSRALKIESSALSKILRGERRISRPMFHRMSERLGMGPREVSHFMESVRRSSANFSELTLDAFEAISDWYHYAILDLMKTERFQSDAKWMASALGITIAETQEALSRLVRLGLAVKDKCGAWKPAGAPLTTIGNPFSAAAFRKYQRQVLEKAIEALEHIPFEKRDHSAMSMSIDSSLLPEAKERIKRFRRELCQFLENSSHRDEVYHLSVSLYPVSRIAERSHA